MIRITSCKDGFRRCGIAHPATPTLHPDDRFTEEEMARLIAEPLLVVEVGVEEEELVETDEQRSQAEPIEPAPAKTEPAAKAKA